jgi:hypothetical protein
MDRFLSSHSHKPSQSGKLFGGLNNLPNSPMDPVSILSTIGAVGAVTNSVCTLAFQLYTFIEETKNIDQAVVDLVEEVNALNSILEAVKLGLESDLVKVAEKRANSEDSRLLWESIQVSLDNCQATINRLEKAIVDIRPESKSFAKQALRRIKLNLKDDEISTFRTQVRTHTNALHMALLMVNLRAACLAPGAVTDELGPKIDELRAIMEHVHGSEADLKAKSLGVEPDYIKGLQKSAQRVISGATTVSANSEAAGSIWGEVMDDEKRYKTLSWIQEPSIYEEHDGPVTAPMSDDYALSHTTALTDYSVSNAGEAESDSDGDFEFEVVETYFARGTKKFEDGKFVDAQSILQRGLQLAEKLPLKRRQPKQIADVKLMIATCIYHSPNPNEAEAKLYAITQEKIHESVTDEGAIRRCQASHLLAGVLFRQGNYAPAKSFCRKALIGRRRVLGKTHITHYESLSLLSQICEAEGQHVDAETYWAMIPDDVACQLVKMEDQFPSLQERPPDSLDVPKEHAHRLSTDEISPTTLSPCDSPRLDHSSSEPQISGARQGSNPIPIPRTSSQSHLSTVSPRLPSQASPSSSRESTSPRLPIALLNRATLTQRPVSTASTTTTSSAEEVPSQRKSSLWRKLNWRQSSVPSTASTAPTEVSVIQEEESHNVSKTQSKPPPPRRTSSTVSGAKPRSQSFLEYLEERDNQGSIGNHWPGLN